MAAYSAHSGVEELVQLKQWVDVAAIEFDTASSAVVVARKELEECARIVETTSQQQLALLQRREYGWTAQEGTDFATRWMEGEEMVLEIGPKKSRVDSSKVVSCRRFFIKGKK